MKRFQIYILALPCMMTLVGCAPATDKPLHASATGGAGTSPSTTISAKETAESAQAAYASFLTGDISLFDPTEIQQWGLGAWADSLLVVGKLEYTHLNLDGDGGTELLIQWAEDPSSYNGVFHYSDGTLHCWQNDSTEGNCRDYPLRDGAMVRQYDFNGTRSYTIFRYQADGSIKEISRLVARVELIDPNGTDPCPYYEVNGSEVNQYEFDQQLHALVSSQMLDSSLWTKL